jgi:hypothetical protein
MKGSAKKRSMADGSFLSKMDITASRATAPSTSFDGCAFADCARAIEARATPAVATDVTNHLSTENPMLPAALFMIRWVRHSFEIEPGTLCLATASAHPNGVWKNTNFGSKS